MRAAKPLKAGHFLLGEADLLAAPLGMAEIGHLVGHAPGLAGDIKRVVVSDCGRHA